MNINAFIALCVENGGAMQIFTPKEIGRPCALVPSSWCIIRAHGEEDVDILDSIQLNSSMHLVIISDIA